MRPQLEYATCVWSPQYKKDAITTVTVLRRATTLLPCLNDKTYRERLIFLGLPLLEYRRDRADKIQIYKILNDIDKVNKDKLFTMSHNIGTRGLPFKLYENRYRFNVRVNYFSNRGINLWNELPENTVMASTLVSIKSRLNKCWYGHHRKFDPW